VQLLLNRWTNVWRNFTQVYHLRMCMKEYMYNPSKKQHLGRWFKGDNYWCRTGISICDLTHSSSCISIIVFRWTKGRSYPRLLYLAVLRSPKKQTTLCLYKTRDWSDPQAENIYRSPTLNVHMSYLPFKSKYKWIALTCVRHVVSDKDEEFYLNPINFFNQLKMIRY